MANFRPHIARQPRLALHSYTQQNQRTALRAAARWGGRGGALPQTPASCGVRHVAEGQAGATLLLPLMPERVLWVSVSKVVISSRWSSAEAVPPSPSPTGLLVRSRRETPQGDRHTQPLRNRQGGERTSKGLTDVVCRRILESSGGEWTLKFPLSVPCKPA